MVSFPLPRGAQTNHIQATRSVGGTLTVDIPIAAVAPPAPATVVDVAVVPTVANVRFVVMHFNR